MWQLVLLLQVLNTLAEDCAPGTFISQENGVQVCQDCPQGYYQFNTNALDCIQCLEGYFQDEPGLPECKFCPIGYSQPYGGQTSCLNCEQGTFSDVPALINCKFCPHGYFQENEKSSLCDSCPAGFYSSTLGQSKCDQCSAGFYNENPSQGQCLSCDPGKFSDENQLTECKKCPVGYYQNFDITIECQDCPQGYLALLEGRSKCESCSPDQCSMCDGYGMQNNVCEACPLGKFSTNTEICTDCPFGYISKFTRTNNGTTSYLDIPTIYDEDDSKIGGDICISCERGDYYDNFQKKCFECEIGKYSVNYICETCPSGYFRDKPVDLSSDSPICGKCPSGFFGGNGAECQACEAGRFQEFEGSVNCEPCLFPTKSPPGSSFCQEDCPSGFEVGPFDATCKTCPAGKDGSSIDNCELCPLGKFKKSTYGSCIQCPEGRTSADERTNCITCSSGKYDLNGICTNCPVGFFMEDFGDSAAPIYCQPARPGTYQDQIGQINFKTCEAGKYSDDSSNIVCKNCQEGTFSSENAVACQECPNGYGSIAARNECAECTDDQVTIDGVCTGCPVGTQIQETDTFNICSDCPAGYYLDQSIVDDPNKINCQECPTGYKTETTTYCSTCPTGQIPNLVSGGSSYCIPEDSIPECSPGTAFNVDTKVCEECPAGTISNAGASICSACAQNEIEINNICDQCETGLTPDKSTNTCQNCTAGKFGRDGLCIKCGRGTYQDEEGSVGCKSCPSGQTISGPYALGASENLCKPCEKSSDIVVDGICTSCATGRYETPTGCENCPAGYYKSATDVQCIECVTGKTSIAGSPCQFCPPGKFSDEPGLPECKECGAGITADGCEECPAGKAGNGKNCVQCEPGFWSIGVGQEECSKCAIGTYQDQSGQEACFACEPGKFSDTLGHIECKKCQEGTFQPNSRAGICIDCPLGKYTDSKSSEECTDCPDGHYTLQEGTNSSTQCLQCPAGYYEYENNCRFCQEGTFQPLPATTECQSCPEDKALSPKASTSLLDCFSREGLVTYVFGMKGDSKLPQSYTKSCEIRPNLVMLCPSCSCNDDSRNGHWDGPICNECRRGFATRDCTAICPAYDGKHDSTMCNGNGFCWYGKFGDGLCYCGSKSDIDSTGENVVVDVRLCPKGQICPGYGNTEVTETKYIPKYYIMQYRQNSVFVLMLNRYTPQRGHMWFKRYPRSIAYENTCLACTGPFRKTADTVVGFWNKENDYEYFKDELQTLNGFHGENCQYECALCLNGGRCHNVPHPYRFSYTIEDTFRQQREIFIPQTNCICSSLVFDPEAMCCPNGFKPFVHYGLRLNPEPYTRFNRMPYITSIVNERKDHWINRDIYLEADVKYLTPYSEPEDGLMYVANNNYIYSDERADYVQMPFRDVGPYNKHIFYGVPRDICRACPGLFGKGVRTSSGLVRTEQNAEDIWWDNAMGASARKCNGIGVCDFYKRKEEHNVKFMGDANEYRIYERGKKCNDDAIGGMKDKLQAPTLERCIQYGIDNGAKYISYSQPYKGGYTNDMYKTSDGNLLVVDDEIIAEQMAKSTKKNGFSSLGYASYQNGTELVWVILDPVPQVKLPIPDSDSPFTIYSTKSEWCGVYKVCDSFVVSPAMNTFQIQLGHGSDRLPEATFNRFDTCFTYTKDNQIEKFGLYITQDYVQGEDPFLGGLCPKGHFCTEYNGIGYKEACPPGYYQPDQGRTRSITSTQCSIIREPDIEGCQPNIATADANDYVDNVCIRCPRNYYAPEGSASCEECPIGTVKKVSGDFDTRTTMINMPSFFLDKYNPWYYLPDERGLQQTDCALVPAGIIHIPEANKYMTYDRPDFLSVMPCPFGLSSRPGTFTLEDFDDLDALLASALYNKGYRELTRGKCTDMQGWTWALTKQDCEIARRILKLDAAPTYETTSTTMARGCTLMFLPEEWQQAFNIDFEYSTYFNPNEESEVECTVSNPCLCKKMSGVIQAPFIRFDKTWSVEEAEQSTCSCLKYSILTEEQCQDELNARGLAMKKRFGPKGCFIHANRKDVGFYSEGSKEIPSAAITYLCRQGVNNDELAGKFARANCFRCPGNSITGPSSTTCTTCFANQLKNFAKEAIQKFAENAWPSLLQLEPNGEQGQFGDETISFNPRLPNYALIFNREDQGYRISHRFKAKGIFNKGSDQLALSDCYLACSAQQDNDIIAIGIADDYSQCACSKSKTTGYQSTSSDLMFLWRRISGNDDDKTGINSWASTALPLCAACQPGKKTDDGCKSCDPGYYTEDALQASKPQCVECEPGRFAATAVSTGCATCPAGFFQLEKAKSFCNQCPAGYFQSSVGSITCQSCSPGRYSAAKAHTCTACGPGLYNDKSNATECIECEVARFTSTEANTECTDCPAGWIYFTNRNCQKCAAGTYQSAPAQQSCINCSPGKFSSSSGRASACANCPRGFYQQFSKQMICNRCPGGKSCSVNSPGSTCPSGKYKARQTWGSCEKCPAEKQTRTDKKGCDWCAAGKSTFGKSGESCKNCPSQGWTGEGTSRGTAYYQTGGITANSPFYHSCPYGGEGWGCNGLGGKRVNTAYITAGKTADYVFKLKNPQHLNYAYITKQNGASEGKMVGLSGYSSPTQRRIRINAGQWIKVELQCNALHIMLMASIPVNCQFVSYEADGRTVAKNSLKFTPDKPLSSYCLWPDVTKNRL